MTDCANPINLQPMHHFRQVFPDEKGDGSEDGGYYQDTNSDSDDPFCDDRDDEMMQDFNDVPTPVHESTGLGQTESGSFNLHLDDSLDDSTKDTSDQRNPDEGAKKSFSFGQTPSRRGSSDQASSPGPNEPSRTSFNFLSP